MTNWHDLRQLLDHLDATGITLAVDHVDLVVRGPGGVDGDLVERIRPWRDLLYAIAAGRQTGHAPGWCDTCGGFLLIATRNSNGRHRTRVCVMTPGCPGRHRSTP